MSATSTRICSPSDRDSGVKGKGVDYRLDDVGGIVDTNVSGTLNLLEEAVAAKTKSFIFTSTTSAFGDALTPPAGAPAAWITEDVTPIAKNIYGVTKLAAENLCQLFRRKFGLLCLVLRTSRFFPEADDSKDVRENYVDANIKANEFLYRRVDVADIVDAHLRAIDKAPTIGFGRYIISATTPFSRDDLPALRSDAPSVLRRLFPAYAEEYARRGWRMFDTIDRVYVNDRTPRTRLATTLRLRLCARAPARKRGFPQPARTSDRVKGISRGSVRRRPVSGRLNLAARNALCVFLNGTADPGRSDFQLIVECDQICRVAGRNAAVRCPQANEFRRISRGHAHRLVQRHIEPNERVTHRLRHIEHRTRERAVGHGEQAVACGRDLAVDAEGGIVRADRRHRVGDEDDLAARLGVERNA